MRYIRKRAAPTELTRWIKGQRDADGQYINCRYENIPTEIKEQIRRQLLQEQGWLCCYTGMGIERTTSHIEHLKPQATFWQNREDVDYQNLLAAYPGDKMRVKFGAQAKDKWYNPVLMVSPLHKSCETRFHFNLSGKISVANSNDAAAKETIKRLHLDDPSLDEMREHAIHEALFPDDEHLSKAQISKVAQNFCIPDSRGKLPRFCFVITHAAQELLHQVQQERARNKAIQKRARK